MTVNRDAVTRDPISLLVTSRVLGVELFHSTEPANLIGSEAKPSFDDCSRAPNSHKTTSGMHQGSVCCDFFKNISPFFMIC